MARAKYLEDEQEFRGQTHKAKSLTGVVLKTVKLWRKHHLSYNQTYGVFKQARWALQLSVPRAGPEVSAPQARPHHANLCRDGPARDER